VEEDPKYLIKRDMLRKIEQMMEIFIPFDNGDDDDINSKVDPGAGGDINDGEIESDVDDKDNHPTMNPDADRNIFLIFKYFYIKYY